MAKDNKEKKQKRFFKDFKAELKKVIWPTPKQLINNTIAVVAIVLIVAVIVFVLDFTFEKANMFGINRLKSIVDSRTTNSIEEDINTNSEIENVETETVEETTANEVIE